MNFNEQTFPALPGEECFTCEAIPFPFGFTNAAGETFCDDVCYSEHVERVLDAQAWQVAPGYAEE